MNLLDVTGGTPASKPWLTAVVRTIDAAAGNVGGFPIVNRLSSLGTGTVLNGVSLGPTVATKSLIAGPGITITSNALEVTISSGGGGGTFPIDYDAVPVLLQNVDLLPNSYDYYMNTSSPHAITVRSMRLAAAGVGSSPIRVGIYRGSNQTAVLVGQSNSQPPAALMDLIVFAQPGQSLVFERDEPMVLAVATGGTTTALRGISRVNSIGFSWFNTTDSATTGFPNNPRASDGGNPSIPCLRLGAA